MQIGGGKFYKLFGILNVTPDSFSDGGKFLSVDKALSHADSLFEDGADYIDIGAQSTRPGAEIISADEEMRRLKNILPHITLPFSIDTFYPEVAEFAVSEGAEIINCVKPEALPDMFKIARRYNLPVIAVHNEPCGKDVVADVKRFFKKIKFDYQNIIFDVGFGFQKDNKQNLQLLNHLEFLAEFEPMVGLSRKRFVSYLTGAAIPIDCDQTSAVLGAICLTKGAKYLRVHNVEVTEEVLEIF